MSVERVTGWARLSGVRIGAVIALALAAAFAVWLIVRGDDESSSASTTTQTTTAEVGPVAATPAALRALSNEVGHPVYWVGPRPGRTYELTRTSDGRIFVRYLPPGASVGNKTAQYTIVGTYPVPDALEVLRKLSRRTGEKSAPAPGGGLAVYSTESPNNVYVAYPGSDVQIEVFDPSAKRALRLVTSGRVAPVG
ncbi:MAG TPA: hypothetical protein VFT86_03300 [Gaiellaceae bacterium]|nr:hypothetical protein [Gaiellaceae bacterium]